MSSDLIDIGVNLAHKSFRSDVEQVIARARDAGVRRMIVTGTSIEASEDAFDLVRRFPGSLYSTAGVHPHDAARAEQRVAVAGENAVLSRLRELARDRRVVAIGECGLDYERNLSPPDIQRRWLELQLELAVELGRPVFLHERRAHADLLAIVGRYRPRLCGAVVHCFTGSREELSAYLDLDLHVSVTGFVADSARFPALAGVVAEIPEDRLMIETDAPFIVPKNFPEAKKTRRNEPALLSFVLDAVARARGQTKDDVARSTTATAERFFGL